MCMCLKAQLIVSKMKLFSKIIFHTQFLYAVSRGGRGSIPGGRRDVGQGISKSQPHWTKVPVNVGRTG